jgi:hypothetical protein
MAAAGSAAPILLLGVLAACSSPGEPAADDAGGQEEAPGCLFCPSDASIDAPLAVQVKGKIDQICANVDGCHGAGAGMMGLALGVEFTPMIDVVSYEMPPMLRVAPGDPEHSYVYKKLACEGGIEGGCMPLSTGFDPKLAALFYDWIEAGAPVR